MDFVPLTINASAGKLIVPLTKYFRAAAAALAIGDHVGRVRGNKPRNKVHSPEVRDVRDFPSPLNTHLPTRARADGLFDLWVGLKKSGW